MLLREGESVDHGVERQILYCFLVEVGIDFFLPFLRESVATDYNFVRLEVLTIEDHWELKALDLCFRVFLVFFQMCRALLFCLLVEVEILLEALLLDLTESDFRVDFLLFDLNRLLGLVSALPLLRLRNLSLLVPNVKSVYDAIKVARIDINADVCKL